MTIEARAEEGLLALLESRRSAGGGLIGEPGPNEGQLRRLLTIAARAPDHGVLEPWRFIVIEGDARAQASEKLAECYLAENAAMEPGKLQKFAAIMARVFTSSPVVVIVVSRTDGTAKIPVFEQELSAGAVCMNLLTAAHAMGFAANWVTGFAASSPRARKVLGAAEDEKIAGVIFIGTAKEKPADRKRPDVDAITTRWRNL
ncbi:Nitroreductase [Methylocella tundrae]|uniref:Putative NAD(P)H nitroreductase n=1 Tax=Methylocella tundrae TaxID=227605 RepID=A0A4U8Z518_METTU|nr:nitroreductase [Methylocella tundrae]WPP04286.1 nitroreductase [Methylocella tundrae]VFU10612.1 Nitroreductase [Methylocella tundrae]VTZ23968.1 Nitroreductase [Methylocella tundrae]VTZ52278.1 Nitroreductase [Methylocella tundrae]